MKPIFLLLALSSITYAHAGVIHTRASYNERTSNHVTAARGCYMGTRYWVWKKGCSSKPYWKGGTGVAVTVNDACGRKMRSWGRGLDLSTGAYIAVMGSLRSGHGAVSYKLIRVGNGRWIRR